MKHKFDKILKRKGFKRIFPDECICWEKELENNKLLAIEKVKNKDKYHITREIGDLILSRWTFNIYTKRQLRQVLKIIER